MQKLAPTQGIYYKDYLATNSKIFLLVLQEQPHQVSSWFWKCIYCTTGAWGTEAQGTSFNVSGNETYKFTSGVDYSSTNSMALT